MKLLAVLKDITPLNYLTKLSNDLQQSGHEITYVCTDGAAKASLTQRRISHITELPVNFNNQYKAAIFGCSTDSVLETESLRRCKGVIPTIGICDIIGAHTRHGGLFADHYMVPNQSVASLLPHGNWTVIGDINVRSLPNVQMDMQRMVLDWVGNSRSVVVLAQQDTEMVEIAAKSVSCHADQKLILGLHPDPMQWPNQEKIHQILSDLNGRGIINRHIDKDLGSMETIASLNRQSTVVVTAFSGGGVTAASAGYKVVITDGKKIRAEYTKQCPPGTGPLPLAGLIGSPVMTIGNAQDDFFTLKFPSQETINEVLLPVDSDLVLQVIKKVVK